MKITPLLVSTTLSLALSLPAVADVLELKSGEIVNGSYAGGSQHSVRFMVNNNVEVFAVDKILAVTFTGPITNSAAIAQPEANKQQIINKNVEIPAGTSFTIRTVDILNSGNLGKGNKFTAELEADIVIDGMAIGQQGDRVYGEVVDVNKARRIAGKAFIDVALTGIRMDGEIISIQTPVLKLTTESTGKRSAGQAVRGAAIGGLIDGSDGAKTGAKVGVGMAILSPGAQVNVPKGTLLDFQFKSRVKL